MNVRTTTPEELPLRPEYEDEWEGEEAEEEGEEDEEEELETAEGMKDFENTLWILHEGQIERIKAKDGEACAQFVEENSRIIDGMVRRYVRNSPRMKSYYTDSTGRLDYTLFHNQLILDLPYLCFDSSRLLVHTMYRDSIRKAYWGYEYMLNGTDGQAHSSIYYVTRSAKGKDLFPSFYGDWDKSEKGEESDKHALDAFFHTPSVAEEYEAEHTPSVTAEALVDMLADLLSESERQAFVYHLKGVPVEHICEALHINRTAYANRLARTLDKLRMRAPEVVQRLQQRGSTLAGRYIGERPDGYSAEEVEQKRKKNIERFKERYRRDRAKESSEEYAAMLAKKNERRRQRLANETPEEREARLAKRREKRRANCPPKPPKQTPEERAAIKEDRRKAKLAAETPEEREARLAKRRAKRAAETPEEREARLAKRRAKRARMTPEEYAAQLEKERAWGKAAYQRRRSAQSASATGASV